MNLPNQSNSAWDSSLEHLSKDSFGEKTSGSQSSILVLKVKLGNTVARLRSLEYVTNINKHSQYKISGINKIVGQAHRFKEE